MDILDMKTPTSTGRNPKPSPSKKKIREIERLNNLFFHLKKTFFFLVKKEMSFNFQHYFILLTFLLRKVNHTLGDHRSGKAWNRNRPNEITADNCKKNCITKISKERKKKKCI